MAIGSLTGAYNPMTDQYYYEQLMREQENARKRQAMQQHAALARNAMGSLSQGLGQQVAEAPMKQEAQPNPVLLLTGDDE